MNQVKNYTFYWMDLLRKSLFFNRDRKLDLKICFSSGKLIRILIYQIDRNLQIDILNPGYILGASRDAEGKCRTDAMGVMVFENTVL